MNKQQVATDNFDIGWIHKDAKCWVYFPNKEEGDIYARGTVIKINPLNFNRQNSTVKGVLQNGVDFQSKAYLLEKCRDSRSIEKDLIEMDIINGAQVLNQLKRRFEEKKIHTFLWNSLIIVNPFELVAKNYSPHALHYYYEHVFLRENSNLSHVQPHIYAFVFNILKQIKQTNLIQVLSISGQSGSGKTETNKQCLRAISYGCEKQKLKAIKNVDDHNLELRILQCDPILEAFGNAKTVKNDNSSRFGKLISIKIDPQTMIIHYSSIKNYFLQKSRIISQSFGEKNFHIFYLFLKFINDQQRSTYKLKFRGIPIKLEDFRYLSQKSTFVNHSNNSLATEKQMWAGLLNAFKNLQFKKEKIHQIWSIVSAVLLLGNVYFDGTLQNDNDPCEISSPQLITNIAQLLKINRTQLQSGLIFNKKIIAGELMLLPLTQKQCEQGRDSMAKAIYQGLFLWIVEQLNNKVNQGQNMSNFNELKEIKLLDIYGFQVFEKNSFEQLCVNYTNQKIHQIYLEQVFIQQKKLLIAEGLAASIPTLNFTDNFKIIELIDIAPKSIFNLLDQSCTLNVKDTDFLANVRKAHEGHQNFPPNNSTNIRNSFIIKHTPGEIQYMVEGFRDKNKDLLRQDIVHKLSQSESFILCRIFQHKSEIMKQQTNKKFLGIKVRKEVRELITEMSTSSNLHFVRCIKPNEEKRAFHFIDRVCYNQIKYLGILDTIQMRKDSYHVRIPYKDFYQKFGILEGQTGLSNLISLQNGKISTLQCRQMVMRFMTNNSFTNHKLEYLFGKEKIFMKMSTKNFFDIRLRLKTDKIIYASMLIKGSFRMFKFKKVKKLYRTKIPKIQNAIRNFLTISKLSKKKKAVQVIEAYWIKYFHQFFLRKRRNHLMALQKYIKRAIETKRQNDKAQNMIKLKSFIKSALETHKYANYYEKFISVKTIVKKDIYEGIWTKMMNHYKEKIAVYIKTFSIRKMNRSKLYQSEKNAMYRESAKSIKEMEKYFKGFLVRKKVTGKLTNILKIQNYIRMSKIRTKYASLRDTVIKIQRAWRKYYDFKAKSILVTKRYFEQKMREEKIKIDEMLFRTINIQNNKSYNDLPQNCVQKVLFNHDRIKYPKISLFYYLLDFQVLCPIDYIYPEKSWVQNYCTLYKESLQKGNPIQYLDISSTHTVCATINKIYQWGEIHEDSNIRTQKYSENIPLPNCRLSKIKACDGFTIIETQEPQQLLVMGDQQQYQESSIKQWSTLKEKYVLLNGVILTLLNSSLTRIPISEKVTQLSCGMAHTICRTSLKKVYTWGQNTSGQLGHGNFYRQRNPKPIEFFNKYKIVVNQVGVTAYGSIVLDMNGKVWWFGKNGTIQNVPIPKEAFLPIKSEFIENSKKYSIVRIIPKWSKSISLIGVTVAMYDGVFKSTQTSIRKKCLQNLMQKWSQDIEASKFFYKKVNPPYVAAISGHFLEKHMYFKKPLTIKKSESENQLTYQQIKNKLVNQMMMIEHAERKLLSTIKGEYRDNHETVIQDIQAFKNL